METGGITTQWKLNRKTNILNLYFSFLKVKKKKEFLSTWKSVLWLTLLFKQVFEMSICAESQNQAQH